VWNDTESGVYTIFDSASPDVIISNIWFDSFLDKLNETSGGIFTSRSDGRVYSEECDSTWEVLPDVHF